MELPHFLRYRTPRITRLGQFLEAAKLCHQALFALRPLLLFILPAHPLVVERLALQRLEEFLIREILEHVRDLGRLDLRIPDAELPRTDACRRPAHVGRARSGPAALSHLRPAIIQLDVSSRLLAEMLFCLAHPSGLRQA